MDTRELFILLLGLAIVGVILRGLYIALQARRGQLRLAIEKNIPEVDLDALEMAELPGGGARVVERSLDEVNRQNSRIEAADARAGQLDLGDADSDQEIPVLMDAVEVADAAEPESADDILLDYPEEPGDDDSFQREAAQDNMQSVAPDYYDDDPDEAENGYDAEDSYQEEYEAEDETGDEAASSRHGEAEARQEPTLDMESNFEDQLDAFSLSAGERIGDSNPVASTMADSPAAADSHAKEDRQVEKKRGLFDRFKLRKKVSSTAADAEPLEPEQQELPESVATVTHLDDEREAVNSDTAPVAEPSEVLVINIMAPPGRGFVGNDLLHVLVSAGLKFGDMNIFHQRLGADDRSPVIFSVANILNPGTFDLNNMESFATPGISLFLALPTAINNLDALERMLKSASQLASQLGGEMKDDNRNGMTAQTIEHYRQRVRDFELRRLKSAASRG